MAKNPDYDEFFQKNADKIYIILPAYNEEKTIQEVMKKLLKLQLKLIVVDDGSKDKTFQLSQEIRNKNPEKVNIYRHPINRGLGAAIRTGIDAALPMKTPVMVTFDADGQHHTRDIIKVTQPILEGKADVVLGKRNFKEMPFRKKFGNNVMNILTGLFYGKWVSDSQSGLRAFSLKAAQEMELNTRDYGVSSEIIGEIRRKHLKLVETPITTIYTDYSLSKGTNTRVGIKILVKLIKDSLK